MRRLSILWAALLLLLTGCGTQGPPSHSVTVIAMDTVMTITAYGNSESALELAQRRILELDSLLSVTDPDSQIYQLNHAGSQSLSPDAASLLSQALELCRRTGGLLDLTIYPVVRSWGFTTGQYAVPDRDTIAQLLAKVDYTQVGFDPTTNTATLPHGMELDLGSVAKGYTGDVLAALMAEHGVDSALLDLGGNIYAIGAKPDGSAWRIAIRDPLNPGSSLGVVSASNEVIITSGGYERYFEQDGVRYWHIIDPSTGFPARSGLSSVTIVGESGLYCDGLSTALFIMGMEGALAYWRANRDFEAILVSDSGAITVTPGLSDRFSTTQGHAVTVAEE